MCDHGPGDGSVLDEPAGHALSRRGFLGTAAGAVAAGSLATIGWAPRANAAAQRTGSALALPAGQAPVVAALHVHASFSEASGSWDAQLAEALRTGEVQVVAATDHEWRMAADGYLSQFHFLAGETSDGTAVAYPQKNTGRLTTAVAELVTNQPSPDDPTGGAVHLVAQGSTTTVAYASVALQPTDRYRTCINGTTITVDLCLTQTSANAWAEVLVSLSYHPAQGGRAAALYQIAYRFGPQPAGFRTQGTHGIVSRQVSPGWSLGIVLDPVRDFATLWPDMADLAIDNGLFEVDFRAASQGKARCEVLFANGTIDRSRTAGDDSIVSQAEVLAAVQARYPDIRLWQGLEISLDDPHSLQLGGHLAMPDYAGWTTANFQAMGIAYAQAQGGVGSYAHPFGRTGVAIGTPAHLTALLRKALSAALPAGFYGADLIEAGYNQRGGADLATHLAFCDVAARNGYYHTMSGVSDNHIGTYGSWTLGDGVGNKNTFATGLIAASASEPDLLDAMRSGRAFCRMLGTSPISLWYDVDGAPMGSATISQAATRTLHIQADGLPASGSVRVVRGPVDYAGLAKPYSGSHTIATLDVSQFAGGPVPVVVDNSAGDSYLRLEVFDAGLGRTTAFTSHSWLHRATPPRAIPAPRRG